MWKRKVRVAELIFRLADLFTAVLRPKTRFMLYIVGSVVSDAIISAPATVATDLIRQRRLVAIGRLSFRAWT